jgi:lipoyl-dependent peroxiredoxin
MKTITRKAEASWQGNLDNGHGLITAESEVLSSARFSFAERIGDSKTHTNPEELIGSAIASCFAMALSKTLQDDHATALKLLVKAEVSLRLGESGPKVNRLVLDVDGLVPTYTAEKFDEAVETTRKNCPIYQLLEPGFEEVEVKTTFEG